MVFDITMVFAEGKQKIFVTDSGKGYNHNECFSWNRIGRSITQYGGCQPKSDQQPLSQPLPVEGHAASRPATRCTTPGIALIGESSGAHLAALYATRTKIQARERGNVKHARPLPHLAACVLISGSYGIVALSFVCSS